ncbi:iron(III) transport system substrate-binding protein [Trinickia symbiotica]|uniref:Iron ABC transporter substrate-binding protein n=1 Tax=Trinickia symbiotica TaxID=863227 RepID=A0A2N7WQR1_9BURK|nr:iron ABC transporter substrate-binding protein [Trinickia symbiotica]PMS31655.1 iron ABC transporter substrate-binding protein [Trinickia symbiotica]PPK41421.1 iron(III) transport system substrate-binding protein [Trinickia symbiotica]
MKQFQLGKRAAAAARIAALSLAALSALPNLAHAASITLYNAQHEQLVGRLAKDFEKETGITVKIRNGEGPALAAQIVAEGSATPADVYFTENSPELMLLEEKGLLGAVDAQTLATVPKRYSSPTGKWVGVFARENVLAYNTGKVQPGQLPASLMDLAKPEWKGKVGIAPSDADFLPLVSGVLASKGHDATLAWLKGLKANAQIFDDEEGVVAAVNRGAVATGVINNYYWDRLNTELGASKMRSAIYHFGHGDIGALVNVSGAAVLKTAHNSDGAQRFLAYLVGQKAQTLMAQSHVGYEYPLRAGVAPDPMLKPFNELDPPALTIEQLGDDSQAAKLLREAGLL